MLSPAEQQMIQYTIASATAAERGEMRRTAELTLTKQRAAFQSRILSASESQAREVAFEVLTRLDALDTNGGWLYRAKRRVQIAHQWSK